MSSLNQVNLIGYLGKDPEVRSFQDGGKVANITIATTEKWKDKATNELKEATEWHRISFSGRLAEVVEQYLKKGALIYVQGSLRTRKYTDNAGVEKFTTDIRADTMKMLGGKPGAGGQDDGTGSGNGNGAGYSKPSTSRPAGKPAASSPPSSQGNMPDPYDDDIPF